MGCIPIRLDTIS